MNEPEVWERLELGPVTPLTWLDLNNIHSTNIYPGHRRSQEKAPPLAPGPTGPSEGPGGGLTLAGRRGVPGGTRGMGLALWHVHR